MTSGHVQGQVTAGPASQLRPVCSRVMAGSAADLCPASGRSDGCCRRSSRQSTAPLASHDHGSGLLTARAWAGATGVRRGEFGGDLALSLSCRRCWSWGEDGDPGDAGPAPIRARRPLLRRDQPRWKEVRRGRKRSPRPAPPPARKRNSGHADAPSSPSRTGLERWPSPPGGRPSVAERGSVQSGAAHTSLPRSALLARTQGGSPPSCITRQS